ncbi:hypothetical protein IWZ01DRAFT_549580 [Phyllosticta capitalensis]
MKSDHYLNLCLQQAALSPMHFRHGCIVVRGGKVIGQGFNDYRPGYDGGALKTGRLASSSLDGPVIASLKRKCKHKEKKKSTQPFTPFETVDGMGGGHHANTPMSMHSEMMAISSALSSSSTLAASTVSHLQPEPSRATSSASARTYSRPNNNDNDNDRNKALATLKPKRGVLKPLHLDSSCLNAPLPPLKGVANHQKNENENRGHHQKPGLSCQSAAKQHHARHSKAGKNSSLDDESLRNYVLIPKGHPGRDIHSVKDRMKHPKLVGADLYVARLGHSGEPQTRPSCKRSPKRDALALDKDAKDEGAASDSSGTTSSTTLTTGSLHDELTTIEKPRRLPAPRDDALDNHSHPNCTIRASRPCYRCLSYMNNVGIKRVFWTNDEGLWEGAKVRSLIDELESGNFGAIGEGGGLEGGGIYVTKHEVLMLRRLMGQG